MSEAGQDAACPSQLYEAAVGYMVSEKAQSSAWERVAIVVHTIVSAATDTDAALKQLKREFAVVEKQIKADYKVARLPSAWKSAKSTALSAVKNAIPLMSGAGVMPKTDVGKIIRATKTGTVTANDLSVFKDKIVDARCVYVRMSSSDQAHAVAYVLAMFSGTPPPVSPTSEPIAISS